MVHDSCTKRSYFTWVVLHTHAFTSTANTNSCMPLCNLCNYSITYDYSHDNANVYQPRRYLSKIWPELTNESAGISKLCEIGCGYGSSILPLLQTAPWLTAVACDISALVISRLQQHPLYDESRCDARVLDAATTPLTDIIELE
jgi:SAM-dependent methyltransferase